MNLGGNGGKQTDADGKQNAGESQVQKIMKQLLNSFPDDLSLEHAFSDSSNNMNLDDQHSGMLTPIRYDRSSAASTPSLSLPDSFDVDCLNLVGNKKRITEVCVR